MDRDHPEGTGRQSEPRGGGAPPDARILSILQRYSAGEISAREAAKEMGPEATEHHVFAGMIAAQLPLPTPPQEELDREIAALRALYGPHGPRPRP
jgi:hypothetical protein